MTSLLTLLNYALGGIPSNIAWDVMKNAWEKFAKKTWMDLVLDAFQAALVELRPRLTKYGEMGEVSFDREQLREVLRRDLSLDVGGLTFAQAISEEFVQKLSQAMYAQSTLLIGGHALETEDCLQLIRNLIRHAQAHFQGAVLADEPLFRRAVLESSQANADLLLEAQRTLEEGLKLVGFRLDAIEVNLDAMQPKGVFVTLNAFKARLERSYRRLPFSNQLIGREPDIAQALDTLERGYRILVVDGVPGIGKTRFCLELAERLQARPGFRDYEIRCVKEAFSPIWEAMQAELAVVRKYIVVVDDVNRIDQIESFKLLFIGSKCPSNAIVIATTRSYNSNEVLATLRHDFDGVGHFTLEPLSNADIDAILQAKPFELNREHRKHAVGLAKGNPRIALIAAETLRQGQDISKDTQRDLYAHYFQDVFNDLNKALDARPECKNLLAHAAALRYVRLGDLELVRELVKRIGYASEQELREGLAFLRDSEILDEYPGTQVVRVFDDNIAEYIVYRFFFDDKSSFLDYEEAILMPYGGRFGQAIFENITALKQHGYASRRLLTLLDNLPRKAEQILLGDASEASKLIVLKQMVLYAANAPDRCFSAVLAYSQRQLPSEVSDEHASAVAEIVYRALFQNWEHLLAPAASILRDYALLGTESVRKGSRDKLLQLYKYVGWPEGEETVRFLYSPTAILVDEIQKWVHELASSEQVTLYVDLLGSLCATYASHEEMDYVDPNSLHMGTYPLAVTEYLEQLRVIVYRLLSVLYGHALALPQAKLKIVRSYQTPLMKMLPFGATHSEELAHFDAEALLPICQGLATSETHLALLDNFCRVLRLIANELPDSTAEESLLRLLNERLVVYRKFCGSYWDELGAKHGWEESERQKVQFITTFAAELSISHVEEFVQGLSRICLDAQLEHPDLWMMSSYFHYLGSNRGQLAQAILPLISGHQHPLHAYALPLLVGLSLTSPGERIEHAQRWLKEQSLDQLRLLASSYAYRRQDGNEADLLILEQLLGLGDERMDWSLIRAFMTVESVSASRVANDLLTLAKRLSPSAYAELLTVITPSKEYPSLCYRVFELDQATFQQIVLISAHMAEPLNPTHALHLSACLQFMCRTSIDPLFAYCAERIKCYVAERKEHRYLHTLLPYGTTLSFVIGHVQYRSFLEWALRLLAIDDATSRSFRLDLLSSILGSGQVHPEGDAWPEFDPVTYEVFVQWINGTPEQFLVIVDLLTRIHPWNSWFGLVRHIAGRRDIAFDRERLITAMYTGGHSGPASAYYESRLELVGRHRREDDPIEVSQFFDVAEAQLRRLIEREKEAEQLDIQLGRTWRRGH